MHEAGKSLAVLALAVLALVQNHSAVRYLYMASGGAVAAHGGAQSAAPADLAVVFAHLLSVVDELVPADAAAWWEDHRPAALRVVHNKRQSPVAAAVAGHGGRYIEHERPRAHPCRGPRAPRGRGG